MDIVVRGVGAAIGFMITGTPAGAMWGYPVAAAAIDPDDDELDELPEAACRS